MTATYIHTKRKVGFARLVLRFLAFLYFAGLAAAIIYIWGFTQDRYVTSAAFKISRQDGTSMDSGLVHLAIPGLSDSGSMDSQIAIGFIASADLLLELEKQFNLVAHYTSPEKDFVFRLEPGSPLEERLDFYRHRIFAHFNKDTGMTQITVDTFEPRLSHEIADTVLRKSEAFINRLNQEIADQQLSFVRTEVERTGDNVEELNSKLLQMQNEHKFISPDDVIQASLASLQELQMDRLRAEAELATILRDSPDSPTIEPLRSRLRSLQELIDAETAKLSGPERDRMSQILVEFKELQLKLEFANRLRTAAESMLEKNRMDAVARSRFFSVIQRPFIPEEPALPRRTYATVSILVLGLLVFFVFRALTRSVFEAS